MALRDFLTVIRELSFDHLRAEALLTPRLLVIARDPGEARLARERLFGAGAESYVDVHAYDQSAPDPLQYDVIVSVGRLDGALERRWRDLFRRVEEPMRVVEVDASRFSEEDDIEAVRRRIADVADERVLAIGRHITAMREAAASQVVSGTSMVNGQFAFVSNIPTVVPVIGNLVAVGADFLVLTKNQLMMIYKLAAIYQRDLDDRWRIYAEMLPVVGGGLVWRTVAREATDLLPLAIGTVPKVGIAYAGTYATGRAAVLYYSRGAVVTREQMRGLYAEAMDRLRRNPLQLFGRSGREEPDQTSQPPYGDTQAEPA
ncbi:MAG TPA: hypothetical protein VFN57_01905 [Thermomicrobiaceae bacterium]|nr:hypothetical protein [Thermomicrobiaceae bacterium]